MVSLSSSTPGGNGCLMLFTLCQNRSTIFTKDASMDSDGSSPCSKGNLRPNTA